MIVHASLISAILSAVFLCFVVLASGQDDAVLRELDEYVAAQMDQGKIPGLALAVVREDRLNFLKGYATADDNRTLVTRQTPFIIHGNCNYAVIEAGKIDLDAPVQKCIPWFDLADSQAAAAITVRHLLHHTRRALDVHG
jgi:CubicO group peptidase (beta-lactamase class C family)